MLAETFGDFEHGLLAAEECLTLSFSPSARTLRERWRNNGLSADFVSDYFATFIPSDHADKAEIKTAVSYIANELLENAMKFCDYDSAIPVILHLDLEHTRIVFTLTNSITLEQKQKLQAFLAEFCMTDPMEFFIQQMEKNAIEESHNSGVGFATMINDYNAQVGWCIEEKTSCIQLLTRVCLPL